MITHNRGNANGKKTREAIAEAALGLFVEKGIEATTTREIARHAGISEGAIYRHFPGKDSLALELFTSNMAAFANFLEESVGDIADPREALARLVRAFFRFASEQAPAYSYVIFAHHAEFDRMPQEVPKPKDVFERVIRQGIASGDFAAKEVSLAAAMVIGVVIRVIFFLEHGLIRIRQEEAAEEVIRASLRILAAREAAQEV